MSVRIKRISLMVSIYLFLCACHISMVCAQSVIILPDIISDNMIIQQCKPIRFWGSASKGDRITAKIKEWGMVLSQNSASVDKDGNWKMELPSLNAGGPYTVEFITGSTAVTISNVLVGELWVQSGQSNMAFLNKNCNQYASKAIPSQAINEIRLFINTKNVKSENSRETNLAGHWLTADETEIASYSATGYAALEELYLNLKIPVGGICNAVDGAGMADFMGPDTIGNNGGAYYNAKTAPLTNLNIRGVMWYQGEANRNESMDAFAENFKKIISTWRADWNDEKLPFIFVQLPASPMRYYASWTNAYIVEDFSTARLAQMQTYYETEHVGMAVSIDCAPFDAASGEDSLHPWNKRPVGQRMGKAALALVYGYSIVFEGPLYQSMSISGNKVILTFGSVGDGLKTIDGKAPRCFYVAGKDGVYYKAVAEIIKPNQISLTSASVNAPLQVAYSNEKIMYPYNGYADQEAVINTYPDVNLVNSEGLPASPFNTDVSYFYKEKSSENYVNCKTEQYSKANEEFVILVYAIFDAGHLVGCKLKKCSRKDYENGNTGDDIVLENKQYTVKRVVFKYQ